MTTVYIARTYSGFHVKLKSDDPQAFRLCIDTLKSSIAPDQRSYNPTTREWFVDEDATDRMRRWLEYCRANLYAEVEWLDGAADADPDAEWKPPPSKPRPKSIDPYRTLHLLPSAPPEVIRAAFKALAMKHHPDHGGDEEQMKRLNAAFKMLAA